MNLSEILSQMASGLTGIRLITLIDNDWMALAYWASPENNISPEELGGFVQQINSTINTFKPSTAGLNKLDDVILNTHLGYMILKPICNGTCFLLVNAPRTVSLGLIRTACQNFTPLLEQALHCPEPVLQMDGIETSAS